MPIGYIFFEKFKHFYKQCTDQYLVDFCNLLCSTMDYVPKYMYV